MACPSPESKSLLLLLSSLTYRKTIKTPKNITDSDNINLGNIQLQIFSLSDGVLVQPLKRMDLHSYALLFDSD